MASGNILAIKLGTTHVGVPGFSTQSGYRAILAVRTIVAKVQTTVLFGDSLYSVGPQSNLDSFTIFRMFVNSYGGRNEIWAQLSQVPLFTSSTYNLQYQAGFLQVPQPPPISEGQVTALQGGYDPLRGYWVEFAGNFFLGFPLFQDQAANVIRDGPTFKGFQPSANNPGSGSGGTGGSGTGGSSGGTGGGFPPVCI